MEVTIEEAIQHIKNSCYIVGYPTHDRQGETRKRINASLDLAIDIMCKYQKIKEIMDEMNGDFYGSYLKDRQALEKIYEVVEDEKSF